MDKKLTITIDRKTYDLLASVAHRKGITKNELLKRIIYKEIRFMAYTLGIFDNHQITGYINKWKEG